LKTQAISVLIVEDEAMTAMFMETMLRRKGFNVLKCVSSGEEAVNISLELNPDFVLMDIRLAGKMDGIEAVTKIKAVSMAATKFIFTTGYSDLELKEKMMELEPEGVFIKPVNVPELVNLINFSIKRQG